MTGAWRGDDPRERIEAEVDEEIRLHLERRTAELRAQGWEPEAARREARRRFGDIERTRVVCVTADQRWEARMRRRSGLEDLRQDLATSWRSLGHRPGFTAAAVLTLALGVGIATVIFSVADHVLFRPLPFAEPERTVTLWVADAGTGESRIPVQSGDFLEWQARATAFESMALAEPFAFDIATDERAVSVPAWLVTPGFFATVGLNPRLGRGFAPEDAHPGAAPVVVVSDGFWKQHLGGDPGAVGSTVVLDGRSVEVIGVLPDANQLWPAARDLWAPKSFREYELQEYGRGYMYAAARLARGVNVEHARQDMARVDRELDAVRRVSAELGVSVIPLEEHVLGDVRPALLILLGAVGLLLLVACANVAGLLLARGAQRADELAVRAALGADRSRLFAQLFTESALLATAGGVLGLAFALGGVELLGRTVPPELPRAAEITLDPRVLAFALVATVGTAILCGLLPAVRFSRAGAPLGVTGGGGARGATSGRSRNRLRRGLVLLEVSTAMVLMVGAGLLGRSYASLVSTDLGFEWDGVAGVQVFLWDRNPTGPELLATATAILERIRALPGVSAAGIGTAPPFLPDRIDATNSAVVEGVAPDEAPVVYTTIVDEGYFETLSIPVIRGRAFHASDDRSGERVTLLNEAAARLLFPDADPVGRQVTFGVMGAPATWLVVGVVGDVRPEAFDSPVQPEVFVPLAQTANGSLTFLAKGVDAEALVPALRGAVWQIDDGQSVYWAATMESVVSSILAERRFQLILFGLFGALSLSLAAVGLFGLISFTAQQRAREVGIRVALGARRHEIIGLVVREGLVLVVAGVTLGALAAATLSRVITSLLHGVERVDPLTYGSLAVVMVAVALLASFLPARRAANGDPVRALRSE
jgi:putative ABC transport system permease protein